ncbi:MAG TPA: SDR family oxidoreductase [Acidimicrobiia bacterium]|jgi:NAD(P)-dependent dehydrogenase (short-subunit alcohol dehydrogenase family)
MHALRGGVAVVTGGAGTVAGLGQGLVRQFARAGMRVAIIDVDGDAAARLARELQGEGVEAIACTADVTHESTLRNAVEQVRDGFGACNILCAHVGGGGQGRFDTSTIAEWRSAMELMVVGTVATVQAFLPLMRETTGHRRIVLTSSAAALAPGRFQGPYRAAKAAVTSLGETLDLELGPEGIGATIVFPSGMLVPELLEFMRTSDLAADGIDPVVRAIAEEMAPEPSDLATGESAAEPVVDAVAAGLRYVVTHGVTVGRVARARQDLLDQALAEAARRAQA